MKGKKDVDFILWSQVGRVFPFLQEGRVSGRVVKVQGTTGRASGGFWKCVKPHADLSGAAVL